MKIIHENLELPGDPTPWMIAQPTENKSYCVLWLQGWGSTIEKHKAKMLRLAERTGITFAILDYAGHGSHPVPLEETTRQQQFNEVCMAFDTLKAEGYENIIVAGMSFGGYMAALLAAEREPSAIILRAPAIYKDDEFSLPYPERQGYRDQEYEALKATITPESDMAALHAISRFDGTVYVVEHEIDSVIPRNIPRAYFAVAKRGNYLVVPATDHAVAKMPQPEKHDAYIERLIASIVGLVQQEKELT